MQTSASTDSRSWSDGGASGPARVSQDQTRRSETAAVFRRPRSSTMNDDEKKPKMLGGVTGKGFRPGQSGNPLGRPRKGPLTDCYKAVVEQPLPEDLRLGTKLPEGAIWGDAIALGQARAAIKG